jgi:hypothetical protein
MARIYVNGYKRFLCDVSNNMMGIPEEWIQISFVLSEIPNLIRASDAKIARRCERNAAAGSKRKMFVCSM